jgi:hypothetical protein
MKLSANRRISELTSDMDTFRERYAVVLEVLDEQIAKTGILLETNYRDHLQVTEELFRNASEAKRSCGIYSRSNESTHKIIKRIFWSTVRDIGSLMLLLVIIFTLVRLPELIKDIIKSKSKFLSEKFKLIIKHHVQEVAVDLFCILKFILCTVVIFCTVGGIPHFFAGHIELNILLSLCDFNFSRFLLSIKIYLYT